MPRPILNPKTSAAKPDLSHSEQARTRGGSPLSSTVGRKRSKAYLEALKALDHGTITAGSAAYAQIAEALRQEFGGEIGNDALLGIVGRCYLGPTWEVHTLDLVGQIITHYHLGEALPGDLERARRLALHPAYLYIEVYRDKLCCVRSDGTVSEA